MAETALDPVRDDRSRRWAITVGRRLPHPPERVFRILGRIGGANGYLFADRLWDLRGRIDRWLGGHGIDRSRPVLGPRPEGRRFDFWVVTAHRPPHLLELRADLRMPGRGSLRIDVEPRGGGSAVTLTASFEPYGVLGGAYWFGLYPIHDFVFRGMLRALHREADRVARNSGRDAPFRPVRSPASAPCLAGCPAGNDVRGFVAVVAQRERLGLRTDEAYARAFALLAETNPFPATTGRVCPHPCESGCNRTPKDGAVAVHLIERFLGDWAIERGLPLPTIAGERRSESIGVVGAGPAGLSFAYQMARRGYPVTVYERSAEAGGMLRWGIPRYRLPLAVIDAEVARIRAIGVDLVLGAGDGHGVPIDDLRVRHDALFVAIGLQRGRPIGIPGEELPGVSAGVDYLRKVHEGNPPDLGRHVVVVGGGNTAIDAARVALRSGASVTILYRRGIEQMPAIRSEIDEALDEGVTVQPWKVPVAIEACPGGGLVLRVQSLTPGPPDDDGRPGPVAIEGAVDPVVADAVLVAVAQEPDWTLLDTGTDDDRVLTGGDVVRAGIVSEAIGFGRRAAEAMDARLRGRCDPPATGSAVEIAAGAVKLDLYRDCERTRAARLSPGDALADRDAEIHHGISGAEFDREAARCLSCGRCFGCQNCWTFCMHGGFEATPEPAPGRYFDVDLDPCRGCGKCADLCPCGFLQVAPTSASPEDPRLSDGS